MNPKITGALFDLDGTLIDSAQDICTSANFVLNQRGKNLYQVEQIRPLIGLPASAIFTTAGIDEDVESAVAEFREHLGQTGGDPKLVYPGVVAGLETLASHNIPLAIATNKPTELAIKVIERSGLLNFFDHVQGSDSLPPKPAPDILHKAADAINSPFGTTCMVGDSHVDIQASKAAGCYSIGIIYHEDYAQSMVNEKPDFLISSVEQLIEIGAKSE